MNVNIEKVVIHRLVNGVFFASIYSMDENGKQLIFDSRPSDAVALAVRLECPIYAIESLLKQAGITPQEEQEADGIEAVVEEEFDNPEKQSREELEQSLKEAVENEDYELAARLRDKLDKLK